MQSAEAGWAVARRAGRSLGLLVAAIALGCAPQREAGPPESVKLPPPPIPIGAKVDPDKIIEEGRKLTYDQNPGSSDESVLDDGVRAVIEPQAGVWQLDSTILAQGVVVARLRNRTGTPLKRLALIPNGVTYWFISRQEGKLISALIPDTTVRDFDLTDLVTEVHRPTRAWRQPIAQWQLPGVLRPKEGLGALGIDQSGMPWVSCATWACCKVGGL